MKLPSLILAAAAALTSFSSPAQPARSPIASNPVVTLEGKVQKLQIAMRPGMPFLELQAGDQITRVYLGSMRYLIEQNFNPKVGTQVSVKGYSVSPDVIAISVTVPSEKKVLKLRDENGWPLWRGGMMMHGLDKR